MDNIGIVLIVLIVGIIFAFFWNLIRQLRRYLAGPAGDGSIGLEATDVDAFNDATRFNQGKAASTGRSYSAGYGARAQRGPLRMGKTGDEYSKNYHKLFGRKSK